MNRCKILIVVSCCAAGMFLANCGSNTNSLDAAPGDTTAVGSTVDSLFRLLIQRVQSLDTTNSFNEVTAVDFASLRNGFNTALTKNLYHPKANLGYMISALLSLNTSQQVKNMVDSLDIYFDSVNSVPAAAASAPQAPSPLMKNAYKKEGIIGLGKALAAKTGGIMTAFLAKPSFPTFMTLSYIQNIAELEVVPVLDGIIQTAERLENMSGMTINVIIDDNGLDTFVVDKGEIYVADAAIHLTRAFMGMFCAYDMEMYAPGTSNYSWIDTLINGSDNDRRVITLSGDTLYNIYTWDDSLRQVYAVKMFKYNLERQGFLTIRRNNHARVKTDLIAVTNRIKSAVTYVRNESGLLDNHIIRMADINDADQGLVDFRTNLLDNGISPALANKFSTPETIADFVQELISGPYLFSETIDSVTIQLRVNLAAWFDDPVTDLKTLLPHYTWTSENTWSGVEQTYYQVWDWGYSSYTYPYYKYPEMMPTTITIAPALIDSIVSYPYSSTDTSFTYYLNTPINYEASIDSSYYLDPLRLLDEYGNPLTFGQIDTLIRNKAYFPAFTDYTFHGLFPDMTTRQQWIDLIYQ